MRLGGANRPVPDTPLVEKNLHDLGLPPGLPTTFAPDSLWSYELGSKLDLMNHRMTLNVAAFLLKWKNIQQDITLSDAGFDYETNVGNATSYGFEAELKARVTQSLTLSASVGYTHATFDSDNPAFGTADDGGPNIRKGDAIEGVPKASASLGADYHWAVNDTYNAFVRGNGQWTGKSHGTVFRGDADYERAAYFHGRRQRRRELGQVGGHGVRQEREQQPHAIAAPERAERERGVLPAPPHGRRHGELRVLRPAFTH